MTVALTDEQHQLSEAMAGFAARHAPIEQTRAQADTLASGAPPDFWNALVTQGWHAVHLPEEVGGQGGELADVACVIDAAGYALLPGPLLPTVIAGAVAMAADPGPAVSALLAEIAGGATAAVVLPHASSLRATPSPAGWSVSGTTGPEIGLCGARRVLLSAATDSGSSVWFVLDPGGAGVRVAAEESTDLTRAVGTLHVDGYQVGQDAVAALDSTRARSIAVALTAAEAAGIARWCVDNVVAYLKVREQFGRPIGSFQALQHKAATLYINSELAAAAAWDAARATAQSHGQQLAAAAGAAITAVAGLPELVVDALAMFGAIGYTWEHDLHLYWRRAMSLAATTGRQAEWCRILGEPTAERRDFSIELPDVESDFRARIAHILDTAATLSNDTPGRQGQVMYEEPRIGDQRTALSDAGVVAPHLPAPWGLAATPVQQLIIADEFDKRPHLPRPTMGIAEWILPTVLQAGSDEQKLRFAAPTLRGELSWCQLFSEPGAGSDLASLSTRATKVDGGWMIKGQKVWTSLAHHADFGALLARTDLNAPKHKGISYFLVDMRSPGIDIRPLRQASGDDHFNEVFLDDVFVPDEMLVGEPGMGWSLAVATMGTERMTMTNYIKLDRESGLRSLADDPAVDGDALRLALGTIRAQTNAIAALGLRDTLGRLAGHAPGPAASIGKVATTRMLRENAALTLQLAGRSALVGGNQPAVRQELLMPSELLGGGTVEIQLNIIATMILGLPRK